MFKWLKEIKKLIAPKKPSTKKNESTLAPVDDPSTKGISLESHGKVCPVCGKTFTPKANWQKYCSKECGRDAKLLNDRSRYAKYSKRKAQQEKTCLICGKTFSTAYGWQRYCSKECKHEGKNLRARRSYARLPKRRLKTEKTCQTCGKTFLANGLNQKFCSEECKLKSYRVHHEEKVCPVCGKTFTAKLSTQKFCSKECCDAVYNPPGQIVKCRVCGKEFRRDKGQAKSCTECRAMPKVRPKRPQEEKTCPVCQEKFLPLRRSQKYCSVRCRVKVGREREKVRRKLLAPKSAPVAKVKPQEIKPRACLFCGKIFTPERNSTKMCSLECGRKYQEGKFFEKTCEFCGAPFRSKRETKRFCSVICRERAKANHKFEDFAPRACDVCGIIFTPRWAAQRFCSPECSCKRYHAKKREKKCLFCGKYFMTTIDHQKYCSHDCKEKARRAKGADAVTCLICGEKFLQGQGYRKCCSIKCQDVMDELRTKSWALNKKRRGQDISSSPTEDRECAICGKTFTAPSDSDKKFCSALCELVDDYRKNHPPEERIKKPEKKKTLLDWQREAQQCGMSYGMYRAQIERFGKTFEELVIR